MKEIIKTIKVSIPSYLDGVTRYTRFFSGTIICYPDGYFEGNLKRTKSGNFVFGFCNEKVVYLFFRYCDLVYFFAGEKKDLFYSGKLSWCDGGFTDLVGGNNSSVYINDTNLYTIGESLENLQEIINRGKNALKKDIKEAYERVAAHKEIICMMINKYGFVDPNEVCAELGRVQLGDEFQKTKTDSIVQ